MKISLIQPGRNNLKYLKWSYDSIRKNQGNHEVEICVADDFSNDGTWAWCEEVMAVAEETRMAGPPILVGHTKGGRVALTAAAAHGSHLAGIVIMDSPVTAPDPEMETSRRNQFQDPKVYPDTATAIKRFRTVPAQANYESYIMNHIATMSVRPTGDLLVASHHGINNFSFEE